MKLIFLGAPGAGKGTIASAIGKELGLPQVSTGDLFRDAVKNGTELGLRVKGIMEKGELVPDELTVALVRERLGRPDTAKGYILDGFPRTIPQAEALASFQHIDGVINFLCGDEVVVSRLSGRRICRSCGAIYHVQNLPPRREGICDRCGGELYVRDDDRIDSIRNRLRVYREQTEPLVGFYRGRGLLYDIDSEQNVENSLVQLRQLLKKLHKAG
jgi:adenylate kinase